MTDREKMSHLHTDGHVPPCCFSLPSDGPAARAYAAYNAGGEQSTAGLNYQGKPCPEWENLPPNVKAKWEAAVKNL